MRFQRRPPAETLAEGGREGRKRRYSDGAFTRPFRLRQRLLKNRLFVYRNKDVFNGFVRLDRPFQEVDVHPYRSDLVLCVRHFFCRGLYDNLAAVTTFEKSIGPINYKRRDKHCEDDGLFVFLKPHHDLMYVVRAMVKFISPSSLPDESDRLSMLRKSGDVSIS